jgi:hypothetical protein
MVTAISPECFRGWLWLISGCASGTRLNLFLIGSARPLRPYDSKVHDIFMSIMALEWL